MTDSPHPDTGAQAAQTHDLAHVQKKAESARALLSRLLQELVVVEHQAGRSLPPLVLEVNEQLVLSSLRHLAESEAAAQALETVSRSVGLDPLTQLPNRALLRDRCARAAASAKRRGGRLALLFLDLDHFKPINDVLGHALGDDVLKAVAQRLRSAVREADTVSRYGGDEFLILLSEVSQPDDVEQVADKLIASIGELGQIGGHALRLSASIGISLYPDDGEDIEALIRKADEAMYRAKRHSPGSYGFHLRASAADRSPTQPAVGAVRALTPVERRNAELCEANRKLVVATLDAQALQATAEQALQRQAQLLDLVAWQAIAEGQTRSSAGTVDAAPAVAGVDPGPPGPGRGDLDLVDVIKKAVAGCRESMRARDQRVTTAVPDAAVWLRGSRAQLQLLVRNLLDRASRHTPDGGVIGLSLDVAHDTATLTVSDGGSGTTPQALPDIDGLGLAVVRALADAQGGSVSAFGEGRGQGRRFVVRLQRTARSEVPDDGSDGRR